MTFFLLSLNPFEQMRDYGAFSEGCVKGSLLLSSSIEQALEAARIDWVAVAERVMLEVNLDVQGN